MSAIVWSTFGGWWARLLGRRSRLRTETNLVSAPPEEAPAAGTPLAAHRPKAPEPSPTVHTQAWWETLRLTAPVTTPAPTLADSSVRDRTLAALGNLQQIPTLQSFGQGFLRILNQSDVDIPGVVAAISKDSALCMRILRMANSVLISPKNRIEDLDTAVQMLGLVRVRKAAQVLFMLRDGNQVADGFDWRHLWMHAIATAAMAEELGQQLGSRDTVPLHLAALLHDVGKIVLSTIAPDEYRDILIATWNGHGRLEELERARLGVDHREAGVCFARHCGMPEVVVQAIAHHDQPERAESFRFEVALVSLANYLSKAHGLGFSGARLDASDGEFDALPAWRVIKENLGGLPDLAATENEMAEFAIVVRGDLRELHHGGNSGG